MSAPAWRFLWSKPATQLRLRFAGAAGRLARLPLLGPMIRRVGSRLVPRGATVWRKIQHGEAHGRWILVDARSEADLHNGRREPAVQQALRQHLASGMVFYDIGANVGFFCLVAANILGPGGRIFAFEAEPDAVGRLRRVVERNGLENITVVENAVWSKCGEVSFERCLGSPDRFVGHVVEGAGVRDTVRVPAVTLDDFARSAPMPDLIKCDVEGAEVEVFRGAATLLQTRRPAVICEVHSRENLREIELLFRHAGYELTVLETGETFITHLLALWRP